jgi:hypothetical protein
MKRKNKKIKKVATGDFMTSEMSSSMYESGKAAADAFQESYQGGDGGGAPTTTQTQQAQKDTGIRGFVDTRSAALNLIGQKAFDVSGLGLAVKAAQKVAPQLRAALTPSTTKKTADARLSGSFTTNYAMKPVAQPIISGGDSEPIIKKPILPTTPETVKEVFTAKKFFPFRAYRNGGVPSGPPPKRGPNPQVPPIKLSNGGVKTKAKKNDSMRGIGKAIRGTKFTGVY